MKRYLIIGAAVLALLAPGLLIAQGELSLEGLADQVKSLTSKVAEIFTTQDDLAQRLAAVETAIAPTPTPTATPSPTVTATATHTTTTVPSPTPLPDEPFVTLQRRMNVQRGPGTHHDILGTAEAGVEFDITGKNLNGDWWQIDYDGQSAWVYAPYVTANYVDSVQIVPTPTALPTSTPLPTRTPPPTATPAPAQSSGEVADQLLAGNALGLILLDRQEEHLKVQWQAMPKEEQAKIHGFIMSYLSLAASYCDLSVEDMTDLAHKHGSELEFVGYTTRNDVRPRTFLLYLLGEFAMENTTRDKSCDELLETLVLYLLDK